MSKKRKIFKITPISEYKESEFPTKEIDIKNDSDDQTCVVVDGTQKWFIAVLLGLIFLIISAPLIYRLTNGILSKIRLNTTYKNGTPTPFGYVLHMIIFIVIVRILMH